MLEKKDNLPIIWTRSLEDWDEDKLILSGLMNRVLRLPCLRITKISPLTLDLQKLSLPNKAAVFTSKRCVEYALEIPEIRQFLKGARIFCFGQKTAAHLQDSGFNYDFIAEVRTSEELLTILGARLSPEYVVLVPGPKKKAFDLHGNLQKLGYISYNIDLYETISQLCLSDGKTPNFREQEQLINSLRGFVCFASPSACEGFVSSLTPEKNRLGEALTAIALGPTTAKKCRLHFINVKMARENNLATMIEDITWA